jgi:redox-sensitive bicupin YhaK (pirin superfamily)
MIKFRHPDTLGHLNEDWIETYRSFSNNSYYDPNYIHFSDLEVINDDRVQPRNCVPIHQHCDMEILGYIIDGPCYHNDNLHNYGEIPSGCVQRMSSGTGIWHTEGNLSDNPIRYLQIWLRPNKHNFAPQYDVMEFSREDKLDKFCPIASENGPIHINSDAKVFAGIFTKDHTVHLNPNRKYYMYVVSGTVTINGTVSSELGGFAIENESVIEITYPDNSEILLFDLR